MAAPQGVPIKAGVIYKRSEIVRNWNERWGALYPGELLYWKSKDDCIKAKPPRGRIALSGRTEVVSQGYDDMVSRYMFELRGQSITAQFAAESESDRTRWATAIRQAASGTAAPRASIQSVTGSGFPAADPLQRSGDTPSSRPGEADDSSDAPVRFIPDVSGVWEPDNARSESMDPMFELMGLGWVLRKIAGSVKAVSTYTHDRGGPGRPPTLTNSSVTSLGTEVKRYVLDGRPQDVKGNDGKVAQMTAEVIAASEIPPDVRPRIPPGTGPALGAYRSRSVLPDGLGESLDYQVLCCGGRELAQVLTFSRGGKSVTMRRVFIRKDWTPAKAQRLPQPQQQPRSQQDAVRSVRSLPRGAAEGGGAAGADAGSGAQPGADAAGGAGDGSLLSAEAQQPAAAEMRYFWPIAFGVACVASLLGSLVWARLIAPASPE